METEELLDILQTITSIVAIFIAVYALVKEGQRAKLIQSIDVHLRYSNEFNSNQMKKRRLKVILLMKLVLLKSKGNRNKYLKKTNHNIKGELIDFFQVVGTFTKNKILDLDLVYDEYSYWILNYWSFFEEQINFERKNPVFWSDAKWLYEKILEMEKNKKQANRINFNDFIEYETEICSE